MAGQEKSKRYTAGELTSIVYHDIFDYPLTFSELIKWEAGEQLPICNLQFTIANRNGHFFVEGRHGLIYNRIVRKRASQKKMAIALGATRVLKIIPTIKMVAITGSLAMENPAPESDIDLLIVTKKGTLWTTRLFAYFSLYTFRFSLRSPSDVSQKDKLCLNMWLDESDIVWRKSDRNIYTAHEIAQIRPLINKDNTYERFLWRNRWILKYWPNAVRVQSVKYKVRSTNFLSTLYYVLISLLESVAYKLQYAHMKSKITREVVTPTRAIFHPQDWGKVVLDRMNPLFIK